MEKELKAKPVIKKIYSEIKNEIGSFSDILKLVIIIVGHDPASEFYIANTIKKGKNVGIDVEILEFEENISQNSIIEHIDRLNRDDKIHGIMIQKPLPSQINDGVISERIDILKDVDAFHSVNMGNLLLDKPGFIPCTPAAVLEMMKYYNIKTEGKQVVILGRSNIVGKPLANLLLRKNEFADATVTVCHSKTINLTEVTKKAEILIAAIGKANFIKGEMISKNAIILDVGVNLLENENGTEKYVGDVDYNSCFDKCLAITPVPGGIGSVTTAMLFKNVIYAYKRQKKIFS